MRASKASAIYNTEHPVYRFTGGWLEKFGEPEIGGAWLIWGKEKNGKSTFALMLAEYLSGLTSVMYLSAEEGIGKNFKEAMKRAGISAKSKVQFMSYISIEELEDRLEKQRAPKVIVLDNLTIYNDELKYGKFKQLLRRFPKVLFIYIAHDDKGKPSTGTATLCSKLAKIIIRVVGLKAIIGGRCPGGEINIDEEKSQIIWGQ